jgi:hypothetical protein
MASSPPAPRTLGALRKGRPGGHDTLRTGVAIPRSDETLKQLRGITSRDLMIDTLSRRRTLRR